MDKRNININGLKNVLITKDVESDDVLKVKNYFFTKNLSEESEKEGYYLNLKFDNDDIDCDVNNAYYDSPDIDNIVGMFKEWKYEMYFEYDNHIYNAPLHKLFKNRDGFQSKLFVGVITPLDEVEDYLEVENYRQTMKNMGVQ